MLPRTLIAWVFFRPDILTPQGARPTPPSAPQIIFLDQPYDWVPTLVNVLQFVLLATLTYYIFRRQYRQKTIERHAEWYHRVVTDFAIEKVTSHSETARTILVKVAKEVGQLKAILAPSGAIDNVVTQGLAEFKAVLYVVSRSIAGRLFVFDQQLERSFRELCDALEDNVADWLQDVARAAPGEPLPGISALLNDWQSNSLKLIRDYEFKQWQ